MRSSLYTQTAFALFVFLPWNEEFSRSLFLSSFSLTLALNVAFWTTLANTNSFYALFMMGINLLLTAPVSVSLASMSIAKRHIEIGFAICYFVFGVIKVISFGICVDKVLMYDGEGVAFFASECKDYYGIMIAMITISALQVLALVAMSWALYKRHKNHDPLTPSAYSKVLRWIGTILFALAVFSLILLERLGSFAGLTSENPDTQNSTITFGQVFAIAGSVGPLIEFVKYLFHKTENLNGKSPFVHVLHITHFTNP